MSFQKIPPQIIRLIFLMAFVLGTFLVARQTLRPDSFGEYGWYRGEAVREQAALPVSFTGADSCTECHEEVAEENGSFEHNLVSCDACHGALHAHLEEPEEPLAKLGDGHCLVCHEVGVGRPEWVGLIDLEDHYQDEGKTCVECHLPHQPNEIPADEEDDFFLDF